MLAVYALTLFLSAFLLFMVQPLIGKLIVPLLGGFPAVWNTCMVFFQAVLLVGYAYVWLKGGLDLQPAREQRRGLRLHL